MRDQYAGDLSDLLKFSFLRALVDDDRTLGVAWFYVPGHDGSSDGRHLEWRDEPAWRLVDETIFLSLSTLPDRSIAALEGAAIWPQGVLFHREPILSRRDRNQWAERMGATLEGTDVVFLDPDKGLGAEDKLHATMAEVQILRRPGRAVAFIRFPGRTNHGNQVLRLHQQLRVETAAEAVVTVRTNVSVPRFDGSPYLVQRQRWFTVVDPDATLIDRIRGFVHALEAVPRVSVRLDSTS